MLENNNQPPITQTEYQVSSGPNRVDPLNDGISSLELIRVSGSDVDIVNAARVSYGKVVTELTDRDKNLLRYLMQHNHSSPFEHNQLSFRVKAPIYTARQWMRHRINSYNEISYRYVKAPLEFYMPALWRQQDKLNKQSSHAPFQNAELRQHYQHALTVATQVYEQLLEQGVGRELARGVLPLCTYTEFIYTCNLQSFMHFLKLRLHAGAQYEIAAYARSMLELALPNFPASLGVWKEIHMPELALTEEKLSQVLG